MIFRTTNDIYNELKELYDGYKKELQLLSTIAFEIENINLQYLFLKKINQSNKSLSIIIEIRDYHIYASKLLTEKMNVAINDMIHLKSFIYLNDFNENIKKIRYVHLSNIDLFIEEAYAILNKKSFQ